jgi:hypothetical protein
MLGPGEPLRPDRGQNDVRGTDREENMPTIDRILETGICVEDVDRSVAFCRGVLGLEVVAESPRLAAIHGGRRPCCS